MESSSLPGAEAQMMSRHQVTRMPGQVERQIEASLSLFEGARPGVPEGGVISPGCAWCGFAHPLGGLVHAEPLLKTCPYKHLQMAFESSRDERVSYNHILSLLSTISWHSLDGECPVHLMWNKRPVLADNESSGTVAICALTGLFPGTLLLSNIKVCDILKTNVSFFNTPPLPRVCSCYQANMAMQSVRSILLIGHHAILEMVVCNVKRLYCLLNSQVTNYLISTYAICLHSCVHHSNCKAVLIYCSYIAP